MEEQHAIRKAEFRLFSQWSKKVPRFVPDGVVDPKTYEASPLKIVFLLRDPNDPHGKDTPESFRDLRKILYGGADVRNVAGMSGKRPNVAVWNVLARWVHGLLVARKPWEYYTEADTIDRDYGSMLWFRKEMLRNVAVVNIRKEGSGSSTGQIDRLSRQYADMIREQVLIYEPDLVIAGGIPGNVVENIFGLTEEERRHTSEGIPFWRLQNGKTTVLGCWHPGCPKRHYDLHRHLLEAVDELALRPAS